MLDSALRFVTYHLQSDGPDARYVCGTVFQKIIRGLELAGFGDLREKKVLDLGCGERFHFALQCAASGTTVTALDVVYIKPDLLPLAFYRVMRRSGLRCAIKSSMRRLFFDRRFYTTMEKESGKLLRQFIPRISFVIADPKEAKYPLESNSFDLIVSNAVLEHVADVPLFAREVNRLLISGGYFCGQIHNFYSISGGHNPEWRRPDEHPSDKVPPWDHLRGNRFPGGTHLNHWRPEQFREAFAQHFDVLVFKGVDRNYEHGKLEGERFLTPELAKELAAYPRELLLTRGWCMICRKP